MSVDPVTDINNNSGNIEQPQLGQESDLVVQESPVQKKKKKLAIPKYLMKLNDDFFATVTAKQVFLTKMDKMKAKIRHKAVRMKSLVKGDLKFHRAKDKKQMIEERYKPASQKKTQILKDKKGTKKRRNSYEDLRSKTSISNMTDFNNQKSNWKQQRDEKTSSRLAMLSSNRIYQEDYAWEQGNKFSIKDKKDEKTRGLEGELSQKFEIDEGKKKGLSSLFEQTNKLEINEIGGNMPEAESEHLRSVISESVLPILQSFLT